MFKPGDSGGTGSIPIDQLIRPGMILDYGGSSPPTGFLMCDGAAVSQVTYASLFAVIGTAFNTGGEPVGTFRVPNFNGQSAIGVGTAPGGSIAWALGDAGGSETVVLDITEMPTHSHGITDPGHSHSVTDPGHTHVQDPHGHTSPPHSHDITDPGHTHVQDPHNHTITDPSHDHGGLNTGQSVAAGGFASLSGAGVASTAPNTTGITIDNETAVNQDADTGITATDNNAVSITDTTAVNQSATTGVTVDSDTTGITVDNSGSSAAHPNIHPVLAVNKIIKY